MECKSVRETKKRLECLIVAKDSKVKSGEKTDHGLLVFELLLQLKMATFDEHVMNHEN